MISTGNDIVALNATDITRTKQHNFYSKILSNSEIPLYHELGSAGISFENFVWLCWSIKESAFKYLQRNDPDLIFTPVKFDIEEFELPAVFTIENFNAITAEGTGFDGTNVVKGLVNYGPFRLYSRSVLNAEFIMSVVSHQNSFENTCWGIQFIGDADHNKQSEAVRRFLIGRLLQLYSDRDFRVSKDLKGIPILLKGSEQAAIPVSLSHHGQFVAYAFEADHFPGEIQP
ncbi:MAG: 4'-phosphopantetheinyl transferase family protein [Mucilaginibacter sp.]